jgi:hypothetical protein
MVITGKDDKQHLNNLSKVLQRVEEFNLRVNKSKCNFFEDKTDYCGQEYCSICNCGFIVTLKSPQILTSPDLFTMGTIDFAQSLVGT